MSLLEISPAPLAPGEPVEVQNRFDGSWCEGFEIAEVLGAPPYWSYRVRRLSDGEVLPRVFDHEAIAETKPTALASRPRSTPSPAHPAVQPAADRLAS